MMQFCPIFRENTEKVFSSLVNSVEYGTATKNSIVQSTLYESGSLQHIHDIPDHKIYPMQVEVVNLDSLECARIKIREELKDDRPVVLNMASFKRGGGGYNSGRAQQEESLCRRSLLFHCLDHEYRKMYVPRKNKRSMLPNWYPLNIDQLIYSPDVLTIRNVDNQLLDRNEMYPVSYISCAALAHPKLDATGDYLLHSLDIRTMLNKWRSILRVAALHKHKNLVLGALGSGVFRVPPVHMAEMLRSMLYEDGEFNQAFDHVFIAILDPYLKTQNYKIYSEIFNRSITNALNQINTEPVAAQISEQTNIDEKRNHVLINDHPLTVQIDDEVETEMEKLTIQADEKQNQANEVPQESLSKSQKRRLRKAKQQDKL